MDAKLLRQRMNAGLGRVVHRVPAGEGIVSGDRRDRDDVAAVTCHHAGHEQARQMQDGAQVDVDQLVDVVGRVGEHVALAGLPGVVHQHVDLDAAGDPGDLRRGPDVERMGNTARRLGEVDQPVGVARHGMHLQALGAQAPHGRRADAGGCPGDEGDTVIGKAQWNSSRCDRDDRGRLRSALPGEHNRIVLAS